MAKSGYTFYGENLNYLFQRRDAELVRTVISSSSRLEIYNSKYLDAFCYCLQVCGRVQAVVMDCIYWESWKLRKLAPILHQCRELSIETCFDEYPMSDKGHPLSLDWLPCAQSNIQELRLYNIEMTPESCANLGRVLTTNKNLIKLDVSCIQFGTVGFEDSDDRINYLWDGLRDPCCALQELRLSHCYLICPHWKDVRSVLTTNQKLTKLYLQGNLLGDSGMNVLCEALGSPRCVLQKLSLFHCRLSSLCCDALRSVFIKSRTLINLDLSANHDLEDNGVKILCQGLQHPDCILQKLRLSKCGLSSLCCDELRSVLIKSRTLIRLDLSKNKEIGDNGLKDLCEGLRHPDCILQELSLGSCSLSPLCWDDLHSILIISRTLICLDLSKNKLGDNGLKILCQVLRHPDCILQDLRLRKWDLNPSSCEELRSLLIGHRSLTKLDLSYNPFGDSGMKILCKGLMDPACKLQELKVCYCEVTISCQEDILSLLSTKRTVRRLWITLDFSEDIPKPSFEAFRRIGCSLMTLHHYLPVGMCRTEIKYNGPPNSE